MPQDFVNLNVTQRLIGLTLLAIPYQECLLHSNAVKIEKSG